MSTIATTPFAGALPPPPGVQPNLSHPQSNLRDTWLAALAVCIAVPSILIFLRIYIKLRLIKSVKTADITCTLAWITFLALIGVAFALAYYGVGLHAWDVVPETYSRFAQIINIHQIIYMPSILLTKIAILLQFVELFVTQRKSSRWYALVGLMVANSIFFAILFFLEIFQCLPREKIWIPSLSGTCIDINKTFVASGVINVLDDFTILMLPISWVWKLHTPNRKKIGISLVFGTGLFACCCSIMRLVESIASLGNPDITYSLLPVALWATAEVSAGLVICCLPVMPRLFGKAKPTSRMDPTYGARRSTSPTISRASRKRYYEMDDLPLSRSHANYKDFTAGDHDQFDLEHNDRRTIRDLYDERPAILRTISIDQTNSKGAA